MEPTKPNLAPSQISDKIPVPEALRVAWHNYCMQYADLMELLESIPEGNWGFTRFKRWQTVVGPRHKQAVEDLNAAIRDHLSKQESIVYHSENINESIRQLNDTALLMVQAIEQAGETRKIEYEIVTKRLDDIVEALVKLAGRGR